VSVHKTTFVPNPIQRSFITSQAKSDLYSSRMGEGKSTGLVWSILYHSRHNPGAHWCMIRDTWENLRATTLKSFMDWFPPGVYGTWHEGKKTFTWASGIAEGDVVFLGMDDAADSSKLMSRELAGFAMDEPSPGAGSGGIDEMIFDMAMSRLRQSGMKWYGSKLAENNPDETHWTYKKFVIEGHDNGYKLWQPAAPENINHLPATYYEDLRKLWSHRPDLIRRFVEGEFGFQAIGKAVTPQWDDRLHLGFGLTPVKRQPLQLCWDFGLNPTCIVTQRTPLGNWNILDALVGDGIGVVELIEDGVRQLLDDRYRGMPLQHMGDPAGNEREQTSSSRTAVQYILKSLGGTWRNGPVKTAHRVEPLRAVLTRTLEGKGLVRVDRERAGAVWQALRGGWHYHTSKSGITSAEPFKDINSHPGDALAYGAAILFPLGKAFERQSGLVDVQQASYFNRSAPPLIGRPGLVIPKG
jgi:hypothetical protein